MSDGIAICVDHPPPKADGSPRPFDPAWRTETVLALAKGIEVDQAFDRLPILADALEEAGCDDVVLLRHCRECELHEAGCWVMRVTLHFHPPRTQVPSQFEWHEDSTPSIYSDEYVGRAGNQADREAVKIIQLYMYLRWLIVIIFSALMIWVFTR